jgi:hypothetical protein
MFVISTNCWLNNSLTSKLKLQISHSYQGCDISNFKKRIRVRLKRRVLASNEYEFPALPLIDSYVLQYLLGITVGIQNKTEMLVGTGGHRTRKGIGRQNFIARSKLMERSMLVGGNAVLWVRNVDCLAYGINSNCYYRRQHLHQYISAVAAGRSLLTANLLM